MLYPSHHDVAMHVKPLWPRSIDIDNVVWGLYEKQQNVWDVLKRFSIDSCGYQPIGVCQVSLRVGRYMVYRILS